MRHYQNKLFLFHNYFDIALSYLRDDNFKTFTLDYTRYEYKLECLKNSDNPAAQKLLKIYSVTEF